MRRQRDMLSPRHGLDSSRINASPTSALVATKAIALDQLPPWARPLDLVVASLPGDDSADAVRFLGACNEATSIHARDRVAAATALARTLARGKRPSRALYDAARVFARDDSPQVREIAAGLLVHGAAGARPALRVAAFAVLSRLVYDSHIRVRVRAAGALGTFHDMPERLLLQTLAKKTSDPVAARVITSDDESDGGEDGGGGGGDVADMDAAPTGARRPVQRRAPGGRDRDRFFDFDGTIGAFVHGLEDEFAEVRMAAVDAVCELGVRKPAFAAAAVPSLVDMFNDDIDAVRLNAISSISKLGPLVVFNVRHRVKAVRGWEKGGGCINGRPGDANRLPGNPVH